MGSVADLLSSNIAGRFGKVVPQVAVRSKLEHGICMEKFWIVKAGATFTDTADRYGDFEQWTRDALGAVHCDVEVLDVERLDDECGQALPDPAKCRGVVVTGSHAMVTDALPWSVRLESWIPELVDAEVPFFGICYGHQLLARAMGGQVGYHRRGREIGTVEIQLLETCHNDPLFRPLPSCIAAHVVHAQTVLELPADAVRLASNDFELTHAFRVGPSAWGVQFHPEYDAAIMRSYIEQLADDLAAEQYDVPALVDAVRETTVAREVLWRFAQFVEGGD